MRKVKIQIQQQELPPKVSQIQFQRAVHVKKHIPALFTSSITTLRANPSLESHGNKSDENRHEPAEIDFALCSSFSSSSSDISSRLLPIDGEPRLYIQAT